MGSSLKKSLEVRGKITGRRPKSSLQSPVVVVEDSRNGGVAIKAFDFDDYN